MPIDFPNNPISGQTYSYNSITWEYNGVAWDKQGGGGSVGPQGNTGATGATGAQGEPGQSSNYYNYKVHTTTQTPPTGNGEIRYNNASQIGSTLLYVDHLNDLGDDIDVFLSLLKQNDNLIIQDASDSNNYQTWKITSAPTVILNDYTTIPVTGITSAGTGTSGFANNHSVLFIVFSSPIATQYVESLRGLTGAIGLTNGNGIDLSVSGNTLTVSNSGVLSFNGLTGAVTGVASIRGLTGAVGITNGTGIGLSVSGQTMTFSNTGVLSFNGLTGAVTGLTPGSIGGTNGSILYKAASGISGTEYFTISSVPLSGFQNDLFSFVGPTSETIYSTNNGIKIQRWVNGLGLDEGGGSIIYAEGYDLANFGAASLWLGARDGSNDDINSSVKIGTYDPAGTFTELATFNRIPTSDDYISLNAFTRFANSADLLNNGKVSFYDSGSLNKIVFGSLGTTLPTTYSVYLPNSNTTLAGLATTQTFTGTNTFNTLTNFGAGISSAGGTFSALTRFTAGISASGGTFANDIAVNSMTIGRGTSNIASNIAIGVSAYFSGTTGVSNLAIGRNTLRLNQVGDFNTAIGDNALANNVNGRNNTAIGANALLNTTTNSWNSGFAEYNVAVGGGALQNNTTGSYNMSFGASSLVANTTGLQNVSIGTYSTIRNTTGSSNVAIGHQALGAGTGGTSVYTANVSIGANSLLNTFSAGYNVAIGDEVGYFNRTGASNTLIGRNALRNNLTGSENVAIGSRAGEFAGTAGQTLGSSNDSIFIGFQARSGNTTSSNEIVIGSDAVGLGSNTTVIGATSATSATIYGTLNAPSGISASGGITFTNNVQANGYILSSNARSWFL